MKDIMIPFATGLAIFLFGLQLIRIGLLDIAGERLRSMLLRFTKTPLRGFITGVFTTGFLQSSSAVTVLLISFVNAGLMSFSQSVGIILGTNVGTAVTTEILALKIENFALPMMVGGAILRLLPWHQTAPLGLVLGGFGCIFLGMDTMQWIASPLQERGWVSWLLELGGDPIWTGIAVGTLLTAIIQSSSATIAITMGFFATGLITLPFSAAVVLGSNVGTCVTGLLAAIGSSRTAKQVAIAHLILNIGGVLLFIPGIPLLIGAASLLSTHPPAQVAHIQTLFNLICSLLVLPFAASFARGITWLLPEEIVDWHRFEKEPREEKQENNEELYLQNQIPTLKLTLHPKKGPTNRMTFLRRR